MGSKIYRNRCIIVVIGGRGGGVGLIGWRVNLWKYMYLLFKFIKWRLIVN